MNYRDIPLSVFKSRLIYKGGVLFWKEDQSKTKGWNTRYAGKSISCVGSHGYICFNFTYKNKKHHLLAHRVIWFICKGAWPKCIIDHVDGDIKNNSIKNLREATPEQNSQNRKADVKNKLGVKGVVYLGKKKSGEKRYAAFISDKGKSVYLGTYPKISMAKRAYDSKALEIFGEYARK